MRLLVIARRLTAAALALTLAGGSASAPQEVGGAPSRRSEWRLHHVPELNLTFAVVEIGDGSQLTVRCRDGAFEVLIDGLPPVRDRTRPLEIAVNSENLHSQRWFVADDRTQAFSSTPAHMARRLASAGRLLVRIPPARRIPTANHDVWLHASGGAVEATLAACDQPLVNVRDPQIAERLHTSLPAGIEWARRPRMEFPESARNHDFGIVTVSCVTQPSRHLSDCVIESEYPDGVGFGEAALSGMTDARVRHVGRSRDLLSGHVLVYTVIFRIK